jgi:hypothetical protein
MEKRMRKLMMLTGIVFVAGVAYASAAPIQPVAMSADNGIVLAKCNPGTPNCAPATGNRPQFCGAADNPCQIDGGLGSDCQGSVTCGNAYQQTYGPKTGGTKKETGGTGSTTPQQMVPKQLIQVK